MSETLNRSIIDRLREHPAVNLETAAEALTISRATAYELARAEHFPVRVLRIGSRYRVASADLLRYLGLEP